MNTYFVKQPARYRRESKNQRKGAVKLAPVWTFGTEAEAVAFARTFEVCYVEVIFQGKVLFRNFNLERPKWVSEAEATVIRESNRQVQDDANRNYNRSLSRKKDVI
jgi:hypothetical protein